MTTRARSSMVRAIGLYPIGWRFKSIRAHAMKNGGERILNMTARVFFRTLVTMCMIFPELGCHR